MQSPKKQLEPKQIKEVELHKSAGILDDFANRKVVNTKESYTQSQQVRDLTASKVVVSDASKNLASGTNTNAEIAAAVTASHAIATVTDTATIDMTLAGQDIKGDVIPGGIDHGALADLTADDHTQYLLRQPTADQVINDTGGDFNLRIEGDTDENTFFLDAGNNRIGILNNAPATPLDVTGTITSHGLNIPHADQYLILGNTSGNSGFSMWFSGSNPRCRMNMGNGGYSLGIKGTGVCISDQGQLEPDTMLEVNTGSTFGKQAVTIDQDDADQAFIDYQGTSAADAANNISSWTVATIAGYVKIEINGTAYWMPFFNAPTA